MPLRDWSAAFIVLAIFFVGACGNDLPVAGTDGGADAMADAGRPLRADPAPAALPDFGVCPEGWRDVDVAEGARACDPYPASGVATCLDFEAHFPGAAGCERVGTVCPGDGWPADLPAAGVVYLRAGATAGDGSRASPFGTFADALAGASAGDVVAVAAGSYSEEVSVPGGVTVRGACAEAVIVSSSSPSMSAGVFTIEGADAVLENLSVGPSERAGLWIHGAGKSVTVRDVAIYDVSLVGITVEDHSTFDGERIIVRRPRTLAPSMRYGYGVSAEEGAEATFHSLYVEGAVDFGVTSNMADTLMTVSDFAVIDTEGETEGQNGIGMMATRGGRLVATRGIVERATQMAAAASEAGSSISLTDVVLRDTRWGTRLDLGRGLVVQVGASATARRLLVERANATGVFLGAGAHGDLEDVIVRETQTQLNFLGRGIAVQDSFFAGRRILIEDCFEVGLAVGNTGAVGDVEDLTVVDIKTIPGVGVGRGVLSHEGATLNLTRAAIRRVVEGGLNVQWGSVLVGRDVVVDGVESRAVDGSAGYGAIVQRDSSLTLTNSVIRNAHQVGLIAIAGTTRVELDGVEIADIAAPPCAADTGCALGQSGHGIGVYNDATLIARNFTVRGAALCGVHVAERGTVALTDGEVAETVIGACVQSDSQDVEALRQGVAYEDNESNLQATMLPVPGELSGIGE